MVLAEPMKNRSEGAMVETYQNLIKRINYAGVFPKKHIFYNKISKGYKEAIEEKWNDLGTVTCRDAPAKCGGKNNTNFQSTFQIYSLWGRR